MVTRPLLALLCATTCLAQSSVNDEDAQFYIVNGQIYTPGLAIIDSPQPNTPEGGDSLQVAIDVSGDGALSQPQPPSSDADTGLFSITIFLTSEATGLNLTISNGTASGWRNGPNLDPAFACNTSSSSSTADEGVNVSSISSASASSIAPPSTSSASATTKAPNPPPAAGAAGAVAPSQAPPAPPSGPPPPPGPPGLPPPPGLPALPGLPGLPNPGDLPGPADVAHEIVSAVSSFASGHLPRRDSDSTFQNAGCQPILSQEPGSTVKHVNWVWPDCLVGDGGSGPQCSSVEDCVSGSARGTYNISIHQSFRLNGNDYYTIFDLPIEVTNSISAQTGVSASGKRPPCALLNNPLQSTGQQNGSVTPLPYQPYLGGDVNGGGNGGSTQGGAVSSTPVAGLQGPTGSAVFPSGTPTQSGGLINNLVPSGADNHSVPRYAVWVAAVIVMAAGW